MPFGLIVNDFNHFLLADESESSDEESHDVLDDESKVTEGSSKANPNKRKKRSSMYPSP